MRELRRGEKKYGEHDPEMRRVEDEWQHRRDFRGSNIADASRREIDTRLEERGRQTTTATATMMRREGEQPNKSDSLKAADTRDTHARRETAPSGAAAAALSRCRCAPTDLPGKKADSPAEWIRSGNQAPLKLTPDNWITNGREESRP